VRIIKQYIKVIRLFRELTQCKDYEDILVKVTEIVCLAFNSAESIGLGRMRTSVASLPNTDRTFITHIKTKGISSSQPTQASAYPQIITLGISHYAGAEVKQELWGDIN